MKRQIDSKIYNTEVSRLIGYGTDNKSVCALYVKRNGECFLLSTENKITPLTKEEAIKFCRKFDIMYEYQEAMIFATHQKKQVTVYMTELEISGLAEICEAWNINKSEAINRMIAITAKKLNDDREERERALIELIAEYKKQSESE